MFKALGRLINTIAVKIASVFSEKPRPKEPSPPQNNKTETYTNINISLTKREQKTTTDEIDLPAMYDRLMKDRRSGKNPDEIKENFHAFLKSQTQCFQSENQAARKKRLYKLESLIYLYNYTGLSLLTCNFFHSNLYCHVDDSNVLQNKWRMFLHLSGIEKYAYITEKDFSGPIGTFHKKAAISPVDTSEIAQEHTPRSKLPQKF